jgi:hypothetical protein
MTLLQEIVGAPPTLKRKPGLLTRKEKEVLTSAVVNL